MLEHLVLLVCLGAIVYSCLHHTVVQRHYAIVTIELLPPVRLINLLLIVELPPITHVLREKLSLKERVGLALVCAHKRVERLVLVALVIDH